MYPITTDSYYCYFFIFFDDYYLYYVDEDNDKIRVKFDLELAEAVRQTNGSRVLKIFIISMFRI